MEKPVRIDRFVLLDKVATGGMGEVYRGMSMGAGGFQKIVAIKRILSVHSQSPEFRKMLEAEARLSAKLTHANIVQTFDFVHVNDTLLIVMEFIEGKNIRQLLDRATKVLFNIPFEVSAYLINEICKGLEF